MSAWPPKLDLDLNPDIAWNDELLQRDNTFKPLNRLVHGTSVATLCVMQPTVKNGVVHLTFKGHASQNHHVSFASYNEIVWFGVPDAMAGESTDFFGDQYGSVILDVHSKNISGYEPFMFESAVYSTEVSLPLVMKPPGEAGRSQDTLFDDDGGLKMQWPSSPVSVRQQNRTFTGHIHAEIALANTAFIELPIECFRFVKHAFTLRTDFRCVKMMKLHFARNRTWKTKSGCHDCDSTEHGGTGFTKENRGEHLSKLEASLNKLLIARPELLKLPTLDGTTKSLLDKARQVDSDSGSAYVS